MTPTPSPNGPFSLLSTLHLFITPIQGGDAASMIVNLANQLIDPLTLILGITAVFFVIYGGLLYLFAGGDEKRIRAARATIANVVIGVIIIELSFQIVRFAVGIGFSIWK